MLLWLLTVYVTTGAIFAVAFVLAGVERIDPQAKGAGLGFRLLILPGAAAFWPMLLRRWLKARLRPSS